MKRKKSVVVLSCAVLVILLGCIVVFGGKYAFEGQETAHKVGEAIKEPVTALSEAGEDGNVLLTISGDGVQHDVTEEYFAVRVALWQIYGAADPVSSAIDSMKREALERAFAEKHDLIPTEEEITEYVQEMRDEIRSDEESSAVANELLTSMGLEEDYYWNEYKPRYEAPGMMIHGRVVEYIEENGLEEIDLASATYEIVDPDAFQRIEDSVK